MKKLSHCVFLLVSIIAFTIPSLSVFANGVQYQNVDQKFSFTIPDGWEKIPQDKLNLFSNEVKSATKDKIQVSYLAGFYPIKRDDLSPYILVTSKEIPGISIEDILSVSNYVAKNTDKITKSKFNSEYSALMENLSVNNPVVDYKLSVVTTLMDLGNKEIMVVSIPGAKSLTQIAFYYPESKRSELVIIARNIIESFKYDSGYQYDPNKNSVLNGSFESGLIAFSSFGFVAIVIFIIKLIVAKFENKDRSVSNIENSNINDQNKLKSIASTNMDYRGLILGFLAVWALSLYGILFYFIGMVLGSMYVNSLKGKLSKTSLNRRVWLYILFFLLVAVITTQL